MPAMSTLQAVYTKMLFYAFCFWTIFAVDCGVSSEWKHMTMNDGHRMPYPAYGTYSVDYNDRPRIRNSTIDAIEAGYRHIDTAFAYLTEDMVGEAIADVINRGIVKREELFITDKLSFETGNRKQVIPAIKKALKRLKLKYVDLFLIHTPVNVLRVNNYDYLEIWKGLEDAKRLGLTRSIGISNFNITDVERILAHSKTIPAVHQIEINPTFVNKELVDYCHSKNITVTGYSSFGFLVRRPFNDLSIPPTFEDPKLVRLAKKYGVAVSQIVQRYLVDRSVIPIAASLNKEHIKLNIDIYDFTISAEDVNLINKFDRNIKTNPTFANLELVAYCQSIGIVVVGYSPFGFLVPRPFNDLALPPTFDNPTLVGMAKKYGVAVSQIALRYLVDRHIIPIPRSLNKEHIKLNVDIFNFTICPEDILIINEFDRHLKVYLIDYEGLFNYMCLGFMKLIDFVECNNLRQYEYNMTFY